MKKLFAYILVIFFPLSFLSVADEEKPVVIALAPFCDFSGCPNSLNHVMAIRDKVTANLLQNYNCIILSRSNGMVLSAEKSLNAVNNLGIRNNSTNPLPVADYSIVSYFKIARRTPGNNWSVDLGCIMLVTDLHDENEVNFTKHEFIPDEATCYADDVTLEIVKALKLKSRKKEFSEQVGKIDETWAVLPVKRLETVSALRGTPDKDLSMAMELALQQSGKLRQIVDHSEINKVLDELKITQMGGITESAAANIAKLIGADKIIMGSVSKIHLQKPELRLDLFLVDGKNAIILESATVKGLKNELAEKASAMAINFAQHQHELPGLGTAAPQALKKEAEIYYELFLNMGSSNLGRMHLVEAAIPFVETLYLLDGKNQERMLGVGNFIKSYILNDELPLRDKQKLAELTEKCLKNIEFSEETKYVLIYRAEALLHDPERIDEATALAQRHLREHPDENPEFANSVIAESYFRKKDFKTALLYAEKSGKGGILRAKIYRLLNDSANDEKELAALDCLFLTKELEGDFLVRKLVLLRKLRGPQAALKFSRRIHVWSRIRPEVQFEIAQINIDLGNKELAAILLAELDSDESIRQSAYRDTTQRNKLLSEIKELRKKLGITPAPSKKLSEFYSIPENYKVYLIPIGNPDMNLLTNSVPLSEEFLGCRVEVFPKMPIPEDTVCFKKARGQYDATRVLQRVRNAVKIPDDATSVIVVTDKDIFTGGYRYVYSTSYNGLRMISYHKWYGAGNQHVLTDMLAKTISDAYMVNAGMYGCPINSCLNSSSGTAWGAREKSFSVCFLCQKKLKKIPANYVYKQFRREYDIRYGLADQDKQEWMDEYSKIIQRTLAEAKNKPQKEAEKAVDYLPEDPAKGLSFQYYEFEKDACKSVADLNTLTPKETGITDAFNLGKAKREKNYGLIFEGYIKILENGKYQFYLTSDDGSRLWVDDKEVIENDKMQAPTTKMAEVALKSGYHKIKVAYLQAGGGAFLTLYWRGPKTLGQQIPADVLFHHE